MKMTSMDEQVLRAAKEIAVKFIEVGRITPTNFEATFKQIHGTIDSAVKKDETPSDPQ